MFWAVTFDGGPEKTDLWWGSVGTPRGFSESSPVLRAQDYMGRTLQHMLKLEIYPQILEQGLLKNIGCC